MSRQGEPKDNFISQLHKDWKQLDDLELHPVPTTATLKEQLILARAEKKKAFYKELKLFILIAILILTAITMTVFQAPLIFIWAQILSLIAAPIIFLFLSKRKTKEASYYDR